MLVAETQSCNAADLSRLAPARESSVEKATRVADEPLELTFAQLAISCIVDLTLPDDNGKDDNCCCCC